MRFSVRATFSLAASLATLLLVVAGCSSITGPRLQTNFEWGEADNPESVVETMQTTVAFGELFIFGQMQTPTRCYKLDYNFSRSGSKMTLKVKATLSPSANCDESLGGYRYTLSIYNLKYGTYDLTVNHDIEGAQGGEFTETVTVQ